MSYTLKEFNYEKKSLYVVINIFMYVGLSKNYICADRPIKLSMFFLLILKFTSILYSVFHVIHYYMLLAISIYTFPFTTSVVAFGDTSIRLESNGTYLS